MTQKSKPRVKQTGDAAARAAGRLLDLAKKGLFMHRGKDVSALVLSVAASCLSQKEESDRG